jgi:ribosomal protein L11 methylase PrmA
VKVGSLLGSFLFPTPSTSKLLTVPTDTERRDLRSLAPFVPTTASVAEAMLDLANLRPDDYLIDIGCGDGRLVFGAAHRGVTAVGIDIDPVFIAENRAHCATHPDYARASFVCADALTVDLSPATILTCYLMPYAMNLLKPKFEATLKAGTRIVSHAFSLDGWTPVAKAYPDHRLGTLYLWVA